VRFGYHLTRAGGELRPILLSLAQWGDRWASPPQVSSWVHTCGEEADVVHTCRACGEEITGYDLRLRYGAAVAGDSTA
jgi:hypothetical protein